MGKWAVLLVLFSLADAGLGQGAGVQEKPAENQAKVADSTRLVVVKAEKPDYPFAAQQQGLQGQVTVKVLISESGEVETAEATSGNPVLADAAVKAVKKWKFQPFIKNGKAVKVSTKFPVDFAFKDNVKDVSDTSATLLAPPGGASDRGNTVAVPKRVRVSSGVAVGMLIHKVQPVYPEQAKRHRITGVVVLKATIGKDGRISDLSVASGNEILAPAAMGAVQQWRYKPYMLLGEPVEVDTEITVKFNMSGG